MLTKDQLIARRQGIGASEAATILGLSPWKTPLQLWLEKTGRIEPEEMQALSRPYWGHKLEDDAAEGYEDAVGVKVRRVKQTLYHPSYHWMFCHLDRKIVGKKKIVECKSADAYTGTAWGASGTDQAPEAYIIQVQHQMAVTGYKEADIAALIGGNDFRYYSIPRDEELINYIIEKEAEFWRCVETDVPPQAQCRDDVALLYKRDNGVSVEATTDIINKIEQLKEVKSVIKECETLAKDLEKDITFFLKEASSVNYCGQTIITWRADKNGKRILRIAGGKNVSTTAENF